VSVPLQPDPDAMRRRADLWEQRAQRLDELATALRRHVDGMLFEGPGAARFRAEVEQDVALTLRAARRLADQAAELRRDAQRLQDSAVLPA
jgi:hypothetical protein